MEPASCHQEERLPLCFGLVGMRSLPWLRQHPFCREMAYRSEQIPLVPSAFPYPSLHVGAESLWGRGWPHSVAPLIACNAGGSDIGFSVGAPLTTSFKVLCSAQKRLCFRQAYAEPNCR